MRRYLPLWCAAVLALVCSAQAMAEETESPELRKDKAVWGFYLGYPRSLYAKIPRGPDGEPDPMLPPEPEALARPHTTTYLVGIAVPEAPVGPPRFIPSPQTGEQAWLPPHQLVMTELLTAEQPKVADGVFVLPGPSATPETVRHDPEMENNIPGGPLATAIKVGELWMPLTSHLTVEYGVETGLLKLNPFMTGHQQWTGPVDRSEEGDALAEVIRQALQR